jgi:hypothetical protein
MPVYDTEITYEPHMHEEYDIFSVEEITTRNGLLGVRVELTAKNRIDTRPFGITLWPSSQASSTSKWGAFVSMLGNDTASWIGHRIRILNMENRKAAIELVPDKKVIKKDK